MSRSEALKRAQKKYNKRTKDFLLKCNIEHERDVIEALEQQSNKNGYIKNLIRQDIKNRK